MRWWGVVLVTAASACTSAVDRDAGRDGGSDAGGDAASDGGLKDADFGDAMREAIALRAVVGVGHPRPGCAACAYRLQSDRDEIIDGRTSSEGTIDIAIPFDRTWSVTVVNTAGGATSLVGVDRPVRGEIFVSNTARLTPEATTPAQTVRVRFHGTVPGLNATGVRFDAVLGSGNNMRSLAVVDGASTDFSVGANAELASLNFSVVVFGTETAGGNFVPRMRYFDAVDGRSGVDVDLSQFVPLAPGEPIGIPQAPSGLFGDSTAPPDASLSVFGRGHLYRRFSSGALAGSSAILGECPSEWAGESLVFRCLSPASAATEIDRIFTVERANMHYSWSQRSSEPARAEFPIVTRLSAASFTRRDLQMVSAGDPAMYRAIAIGWTYFSDVFGQADWRIFSFRPGHDRTLAVPTPPAPYTFESVGVTSTCCWRGAQLALIQSRDSTPAWAPEFAHGHMATRIATRANAIPF